MKEKTIKIQHYSSPCGELVLAASDDKLCLCDWLNSRRANRNRHRIACQLNATFQETTSEVLEQAKVQLDEYFAGSRHSFSLPLRPVGTDFQKRVWQALTDIPYGETRTYKDIALQIGNLKGVRAVAQAIASNGISIFIPCHRVVGSNHSLTGFAGGLEAKEKLIMIERGWR